MPSCIVKGCTFSWKRKDPDIIIHAFPKNKAIIKAWLTQTGQDFGDIDAYTEKVFEGKKTDAFRICSQHFAPACYTQEGMRRTLKKDALPTIFESTISTQSAAKRIQKKKDRLPRTLKLDKTRSHMTERILNLTLEIIYLLTGENYTVVKKSRKRIPPSTSSQVSGRFDGAQIPIPEPPTHSLIHERNNDKKILDVTYEIIQLLTAEEWEYLEGHKDLYKDVMMENHQPLRSQDVFGHTLNACTSARIKGDSMFYEDGNLMDTTIYIPTDHAPYTSTHMKEDLVSCDGGNLTNTDLYISSGHTQYTATHINEESVSNEEDTDIDHTQYTSFHIKEESLSSEDRNITHADIYTHPDRSDMQYTSTYFKEKSILCKEQNHTPSDHTQIEYTLVRIKEESISSEEENVSNSDNNAHYSLSHTAFSNEDIDIEERDNTFSVKLRELGEKALHNFTCSSQQTVSTYNCSKCQIRFSSHFELQKHQIIHKALPSIICSECGKCFATHSALVEHQLIHTGEKPFPCSVCGKSFRQLSQLRTHDRIHIEERPFTCSVCGKRFRCKSHLISHGRIHKEDAIIVV